MEKIIEVQDLSYRYPDGRDALTDISLGVSRGETVALLGPNGAGKSTLLLHLNGTLRTDGRVKISGLAVDDRNLKEIRRKVGLVFQDPDDQLFSATVFDDVAFGPINLGLSEERVRQAVAKALALVGMTDYEERVPHHLSLGEKKRIAIATVLSMEPEVLVIDEPTNSLDPRSKWALMDLLKKLPVTRIFASHDLDLVRTICRRVVVLDRGRVIADGATERILADLSLLREHGLAPPES